MKIQFINTPMKTKLLAAIVLASVSSVRATPIHDPGDAARIVAQIQRGDYEGNQAAMQKGYDDLKPFLDDKTIASRVRYWRGFAQWRRAINGFNDKVDPKVLEQQLNTALDEFKAALEIDPKFVDAKVGTISCTGFLFFVHKEDEAHRKERRERILALVKEADAVEPDNPRLIWIHGPIYWNTPVEQGGGQDKMIQVYEQAIQKCAYISSPPDPLEPSWGKPELLMSLAYAYMNKKAPDPIAAEPYARAALELVPYWHYTRDILLPQILAAKAKTAQSTP
jgi:tetratricopeptide (TPR) repeat protein